jgi:acetyl-CoA carboxylase biotin carboxyl carrier protein
MDLSKFKDLKDLQSLLDLMGRYDLEEIEVEDGQRRIRCKKAGAFVPREIVSFGAPASAPVPTAATAAGGSAAAAPAAPTLPANQREVTSPMVGTFYRASSPEAEPFAKEGDSVTAEQTLCIIEAMKVMNEIPSGIAGVVREVLIKNGESVEFGQPLFRIEVS